MSTGKRKADALVILVKNPNSLTDRPAALQVFTDEQMLKLRTAFVEDTICACSQLDGVELKVAVAPPERAQTIKRVVNNLKERFPRRQAFVTLPERLEILTQAEAPLAERMREAMGHCFDAGYHHVLVIGGYNPTLTRKIASGALRELRRNSIILGPTIRGGFYLIGMDASHPEVFDDIPVGTDQAYGALSDRLRALDLVWKELELWYDVSHQEDIEFIVRDINHFRLTGDEESARATEDVLAKYVDQEKGGTA